MSKKLLVIDDDREIWETFLRAGLKVHGFDLMWIEEPKDTLKSIDQYRPDAVMLDVHFPGGYLGKPTLVKIKQKHPNLPVMMITGTMDKAEYQPEDYVLADFRYSKSALEDGDCTDLANELDGIIQNGKNKNAIGNHDAHISRYGFIIGKTAEIRRVVETIDKVADQDTTILITGESGTGKELVARAIHSLGKRADRPFETVVCAALPRNLLESELFGHEKGAFTGAVREKKGRLEQADNGTVFLDEIGEIPVDIQVKLLRFVQEKTFERVGGTRKFRSGARILAATNKDLKAAVADGTFREDLYFRLNVVTLRLPPLRERKEDIPELFCYFVEKIARQHGKKIVPRLRPDLEGKLLAYSWPGNIRELENRIERAIALSSENYLQVTNFDGLDDRQPLGSAKNMGLPQVVDRIFKNELGWKELKKEFGAGGELRREILQAVICQWPERFGTKPRSEDLAALLGTTPGNIRRILSEYGISLKQTP